MVCYGCLQLLPHTKGTERAIEQPWGEKTPRASHTGHGREANRLHLDGGRCALYSSLSGGRYEMITRYHRGVTLGGKSEYGVRMTYPRLPRRREPDIPRAVVALFAFIVLPLLLIALLAGCRATSSYLS